MWISHSPLITKKIFLLFPTIKWNTLSDKMFSDMKINGAREDTGPVIYYIVGCSEKAYNVNNFVH